MHIPFWFKTKSVLALLSLVLGIHIALKYMDIYGM